MPKNARTRAHASNGVRNWATKRDGVGGLMARLIVVAIVLMMGSGCLGAYEERARAEAERAEAGRIAAEAEANRSQIEAQAEAEAARIQAKADADVERARAEAERLRAQERADQAASEIQRAIGDRSVSEAIAYNVRSTARQAELMAEAQAKRLEADAAKTTAESYATYALMAVAGILALGFAIFLVQAGAALVRQSKAILTPKRHHLIDAPQRRHQRALSGSSNGWDYDNAGWPLKLASVCKMLAIELDDRS